MVIRRLKGGCIIGRFAEFPSSNYRFVNLRYFAPTSKITLSNILARHFICSWRCSKNSKLVGASARIRKLNRLWRCRNYTMLNWLRWREHYRSDNSQFLLSGIFSRLRCSSKVFSRTSTRIQGTHRYIRGADADTLYAVLSFHIQLQSCSISFYPPQKAIYGGEIRSLWKLLLLKFTQLQICLTARGRCR